VSRIGRTVPRIAEAVNLDHEISERRFELLVCRPGNRRPQAYPIARRALHALQSAHGGTAVAAARAANASAKRARRVGALQRPP
jgi:hypothetical protein